MRQNKEDALALLEDITQLGQYFKRVTEGLMEDQLPSELRRSIEEYVMWVIRSMSALLPSTYQDVELYQEKAGTLWKSL